LILSRHREGKQFFFWRKRTKKTFINWDMSVGAATAHGPDSEKFLQIQRPDDWAAKPRSLNRAAQHT
jgi:hypothetical protein